MNFWKNEIMGIEMWHLEARLRAVKLKIFNYKNTTRKCRSTSLHLRKTCLRNMRCSIKKEQGLRLSIRQRPKLCIVHSTDTLHAKLLEDWMMLLNKGIQKIRKLYTLSGPDVWHSELPQHHENFPSELRYNKICQSKAPSMGQVARELFIFTFLKINN